MLDQFEKLREIVRKAVWEVDVTTLGSARALYVRLLRVLYTLVHELGDGQLNLRAMSLVYTTLLALVPLLAVSFSVLKAFEVHNQLDAVLLSVFAPLGDSGAELTHQIINFVDNMKVGVLGSLGLGLLFYTVIAMVQKVERAFNYTWRVSESRGVGERISDYVSVLVVGPVLVFTAVGLTATITGTDVFQRVAGIEPFGFAINTLTRVMPFLLVTAAFVFVYVFIPNTKVQFRAALTGGAAAGILWETTGWLFASFVVKSSQYTAIYSGFAILIFFMIWIYLSWLILLVGASVAFYTQHPEYLGVQQRSLRLSNRLRERVALQVVYLIGRAFYANEPGWTLIGLAKRFDVPSEPLRAILDALETNGLVGQTRDDPPRFLPARALDGVTVKEVLDMVRSAEEQSQIRSDRIGNEPAVDAVMADIDAAVSAALGDLTIRGLVESEADTSVRAITERSTG